MESLEYEVCVAGGGVAGTAAAIAAARTGARTVLIEESGCLGGSLTICGVGPMMTFFSGEQQIIGGIAQEIVDRLVSRKASTGHVPDTTCYVSYVTPFSCEGLKAVLDEMTEEAGVTVLFHTSVAAAERKDDQIRQITVCNCEGLTSLRARLYIDATGDGDLAYFSGLPMTLGRPGDHLTQPMTVNMKYCNVKTERLKQYILEHIDQFPRLIGKEEKIQSSLPLAVAGFSAQLKEALQSGRVSVPREEVLFFETERPGEMIVNTTRLVGLDPTCAADLSRAEREGRKQCLEIDAFLREYVPGFSEALLEFTGPNVGIRSSRQLDSAYVLTAEDVLAGKRFPSAVCRNAYPIDLHSPDGQGTSTSFIRKGGYYEIPYETLYCREAGNFLAAGRCIGASFEAQAAIRTTPCAFAIGQAAGTAAGLCVKQSCQVQELNCRELKQELIRQGAMLS